jgi:uncharacterized protein
MGDARLDYDELTYGWFDHFLKGEDNHILEKMPKVRYFTMGLNKWQTSDTWPPAGAQPMTLYLASGGKANSLTAMARWLPLRLAEPDGSLRSHEPGAILRRQRLLHRQCGQRRRFDQRKMEARADILVYTSEPLKEGDRSERPDRSDALRIVGRKDTDFTVKLIDVYPDGTAYNLDETIQRLRYREGYEKPPVWMEPGKVYKVTLQPMTTSNYFPGRASHSDRSIQQQFPALRPEFQYRRQ